MKCSHKSLPYEAFPCIYPIIVAYVLSLCLCQKRSVAFRNVVTLEGREINKVTFRFLKSIMNSKNSSGTPGTEKEIEDVNKRDKQMT